MGNILRRLGSPAPLVSADINYLGRLDLPLHGTVGADELCNAIRFSEKSGRNSSENIYWAI
jgi:hypothetical protein